MASSSMVIPTRGMARGLGSVQGATLQRSKLNIAKEIKQVDPKLDNDGGGGNNGKSIFNGGGGDGDDGDDDDYFDEFGDGDGDGSDGGFFRTVLKELYDELSINAVLQEWFRTVADLPLIIRQSVAMGVFSSAQLVRFLSMDVRPNVTRAVTRSLPPQVARGMVGRLMADPAFAQKLLIEQLITIGSSLWWEARHRGKRFGQELDLVAINTLSLAAATGSLVWLVSPNRSFGAMHKYTWQNMLHNLPNHVFDASTPFRQISMGSRAAGFFAKTAELAAVGLAAGGAMAGLGHAAVGLRRRFQDPEYTPSVPIPSIGRSAGGMALSLGLFSNVRYQIVGGIDRYLFDHCNFLLSYLSLSALFRTSSTIIGQPTRLHLQGMPTQVPAALEPELQQARNNAVPIRAGQLPWATKQSAGSAGSSNGPQKKGKKRASRSKGFQMSASRSPVPQAVA